jgi:hypothetical protein
MDMKNIPFGTTAWSQIPPTTHKGETGTAYGTLSNLIICGFAWLNIVPDILPIIGAQKVTFFCAWKANYTLSLPTEESLS